MTPAQLTGRDSAGLIDSGDGRLLLPAAAAAFAALRDDARAAGFDLRIVSAHRSFDRQLHIFNRKVRGELPVVDDADRPVDIAALDMDAALAAVLRFSALPGASRHHWGTDMDVYDAAAVSDDYDVVSDNIFVVGRTDLAANSVEAAYAADVVTPQNVTLVAGTGGVYISKV